MRSRNEKFKQRMRLRKERADRLYRVGLFSVALGIGLAWFGMIKL